MKTVLLGSEERAGDREAVTGPGGLRHGRVVDLEALDGLAAEVQEEVLAAARAEADGDLAAVSSRVAREVDHELVVAVGHAGGACFGIALSKDVTLMFDDAGHGTSVRPGGEKGAGRV